MHNSMKLNKTLMEAGPEHYDLVNAIVDFEARVEKGEREVEESLHLLYVQREEIITEAFPYFFKFSEAVVLLIEVSFSNGGIGLLDWDFNRSDSQVFHDKTRKFFTDNGIDF